MHAFKKGAFSVAAKAKARGNVLDTRRASTAAFCDAAPYSPAWHGMCASSARPPVAAARPCCAADRPGARRSCRRRCPAAHGLLRFAACCWLHPCVLQLPLVPTWRWQRCPVPFPAAVVRSAWAPPALLADAGAGGAHHAGGHWRPHAQHPGVPAVPRQGQGVPASWRLYAGCCCVKKCQAGLPVLAVFAPWPAATLIENGSPPAHLLLLSTCLSPTGATVGPRAPGPPPMPRAPLLPVRPPGDHPPASAARQRRRHGRCRVQGGGQLAAARAGGPA